MIGFNNKEYMPQSREASSIFLVCMELIVTSPLMSLKGSWPIVGYPLVSRYFCSSGSSYNLLVLISQRGIAGRPLGKLLGDQ